MDWQKFHQEMVGRKFRRRVAGKQQTRKITDTTTGCGVIYRWGPNGCWEGEATHDEWLAWQSKAKEIE